MESLFGTVASAVNLGMGALSELLGSVYFIAEATYFFKVPTIDAAIAPLAASIGMSLPVIKFTLGTFLVYPFAAALRVLPNQNIRHLFSLVVGVLLMQWVYAEDWIHSLASSLGTYLICLLFPAKYQAKVAFVYVMGYMTLSHGYRMWITGKPGIFDFTGTQMVLTMKLTSFAYNLHDGVADRKRVFDENNADPKKQVVYNERRKFAITSLPNPLAFFGYVYCFTCILAGPAFEYNDYAQSISGKAFERPNTNSSAKQRQPSSLLPGLKALLIGVICLVLHLVVGGKYSLSLIYDANFIATNSHVQRYVYTWAALLGERFKYYYVWKVAEGASVLGGFGFSGYTTDKDGREVSNDWSGVENIDIVGFEAATNVQGLSRSWNKRTQGWLERYTYKRSGNSLLTTYFISALWHGLYPGFFLFFLSIPILTNIERLMRAKINPVVVPTFDGRNAASYPDSFVGRVYTFVCWAGVTLTMNYVVQVFPIQMWDRCMAAWGSYYHAPHIALFALFAVLSILPTPRKATSAGDVNKKSK